MTSILDDRPVAGFNFESYARNKNLVSKGYVEPKATKTGTTICAAIFADGVVLGADTRATSGTLIANKECEKIHYVSKYINCLGAGTAADTDQVTHMMSSQVALHGMNNNQEMVPFSVAVTFAKQHLFQYQGHVGAYLIVGGVDKEGAHLEEIHAAGSSQPAPFLASGSGSLNALSVLEARWKPNLTLEECKKLVRDSIAAGVFNDLGSGNWIDLCIITKDGSQLHKPYEKANLKGQRRGDYTLPSGASRTDLVTSVPVIIEDVMIRHIDQPESPDDMDTSL